jgi:hypothetical protein
VTIGHNSGDYDTASLPSSVQDIAETLGLAIVINLVEHFAGVELRIPHKLKPDHKLMALGKDQAEALCDFCPEDTILVPISLTKRNLHREVTALQGRGMKRWEIARELNVTQRHVRRIANKEPPPDDRQLDMFSGD